MTRNLRLFQKCFLKRFFSDYDRQAWNRLGEDVGDPRREKPKYLEDRGRADFDVNDFLTWLLNYRRCIANVFKTYDSHKHYQAAAKQNRKMRNNQILSTQYLYLSLKFRP